jgi:hypothetical protein
VAKPVRRQWGRPLRLAAAWLALLLGPLACPAAGQPAAPLPSAAPLDASRRPASLRERHHDVLLPSAAAIGVLTLASIPLGINLVRGRRMEAALRQSEARYRALFGKPVNLPEPLQAIRRLTLGAGA